MLIFRFFPESETLEMVKESLFSEISPSVAFSMES
jgi:hypothetical protein